MLDKTFHFSSWMSKKGFLQGVFWTILCCLASNINDILMKSLGDHLHSFEIVFFRAFFGLLLILPFFRRKESLLPTTHITLHVTRVLIGVGAITLACLSTTLLTLPEVTVFSFSQPLFFLPLAVLLLKEKLTFPQLIANCIGFIGVVIVSNFGSRNFLTISTLVPLTSAVLFAYLDIMNKKFMWSEKASTLIFYFNFGTALITGLFAFFIWTSPSLHDLGFLFLLGISATFIQFASLMALSATEILALAPIRYVELIFSIFFGLLLFNESVTYVTLIGALFIILGTLFATYSSSRPLQQSNK